MQKILIFMFVISSNAYSIEDCNFKSSTKEANIESFKPRLSESNAIYSANEVLKRKKISIPKNWCRDISLTTEADGIKWKVFYSGEELDACFSVVINDKTKKAHIQYCS